MVSTRSKLLLLLALLLFGGVVWGIHRQRAICEATVRLGARRGPIAGASGELGPPGCTSLASAPAGYKILDLAFGFALLALLRSAWIDRHERGNRNRHVDSSQSKPQGPAAPPPS